MVKLATKKKPSPKVKSAPKASAKKAPAKKATAKKASAKNATPIVELTSGVIVQFRGYSPETPKDEQIFKTGEKLRVVAVDDGETDDKGNPGPRLITVIDPKDLDKYEADNDDETVRGGQVFETEIKVTKQPKALAKPAPTPIKVISIGEMSKLMKLKDGERATDVAVRLLDDAKKNYFYAGGVIARIFNENLDAPKGTTWFTDREAWEAYCEDNFDYKPARVRALMDVYVQFTALPDAKERIDRLPEIGWSKAAEISRYITADNADELLDLAEEKNIHVLKETLKEKYVDEDGNTPQGRGTRNATKINKTTFSFVYFEDKAASIDYILEASMKMFGVETREEALDQVLNDWATEHLDSGKLKKAHEAGDKVRSSLKKRGIAIPGADAETSDKATKAPAKKAGSKKTVKA